MKTTEIKTKAILSFVFLPLKFESARTKFNFWEVIKYFSNNFILEKLLKFPNYNIK